MILKRINRAVALAGFLFILIYAHSIWGADMEDAVHAPAWAFGESLDRGASIWRNGENAASILNKSRPAPQAAASFGESRQSHGDAGMPGKGRMGFSMKDEGQTWKVAPEQKKFRPDEEITRDRRHVLRAFADVEAAKDLNISLGPELILKDEHHSEGGAIADQPDSELGLGMKFKYDF